jgi:enoyl-CoA hydratase
MERSCVDPMRCGEWAKFRMRYAAPKPSNRSLEMNQPDQVLLIDKPFDGCAVLTLNRPHAANALSVELRRTLTAEIDRLTATPGVRVLILTGAGNAFCAGLDLKELGAASDGTKVLGAGPEIDPVAALRRFAGPVIGAINGATITGGFELAMACDVLLASTRARFADTHARVGVMPGWGLSQVLPRLLGPYRAKELSLTGNFLSASKAEAWGLVNRVVEPEQLLPEALQLARDMLSSLPAMLVAYKRLIDDGYAMTFQDGLAEEKKRSRAWSASIKGSDIEKLRGEVLERGRSQATRDES